MAPSTDCRCEMLFLSGCILVSIMGFHSALAKVCHDYTRHGLDNNWYAKDGEKLPIMVLMPMNESAVMSSISQGIEPAVQLAIQHIRESRQYSFTLITKIYDTEVGEALFLVVAFVRTAVQRCYALMWKTGVWYHIVSAFLCRGHGFECTKKNV